MGDDCTPIEFSWVITSDRTDVIRFTMEPLSRIDGSPTTPDTWMETLQAMGSSHKFKDFDLSWAQICFDTLVYLGQPGEGHPHRSQFSIGADFSRSGMVGKAYFLPHIRSKCTGTPQLQIVSDCIQKLGLSEQWSFVLAYLQHLPQHMSPTSEIVAVDCLHPDRSRVKVYMRTPASDLLSLLDLFTLGGKLSEATVACTKTIKHLWTLLFGEAQQVTSKHPSHYASGFVVYFELSRSRPTPAPKLYIPVRHYASDDTAIAMAVMQYYRDAGLDEIGRSYLAHVESIFGGRRRLSDKTGIHTYVGVASRRDGPQVSVYYSPEAFSR